MPLVTICHDYATATYCKAIVVKKGRVHHLHDFIIYYVHLTSARFEHFVSLMASYYSAFNYQFNFTVIITHMQNEERGAAYFPFN